MGGDIMEEEVISRDFVINKPVTQTSQPSGFLVVKNLKKKFKTKSGLVNATDDISLSIKKGSICGLVGPNGAGKSTLIKLILGLLKKNSGHVFINGSSVDKLEIKKIIGYMPEKDAFYYDMTAKDYLILMARLSGVSKDIAEKRADNLLDVLELKNAENRSIKGFSSGMKKKILFAQAIIHKPEFIILDEPTANLDPLAQAQLIEVLKVMVKENGTTVLISSHHIEELEKLIDYLVIINKGKLVIEKKIEDAKSSKNKKIEVELSSHSDLLKLINLTKETLTHSEISYNTLTIFCDKDSKEVEKYLGDVISGNNISTEKIETKNVTLWDYILDLLKKSEKS
jgi:ABC-type multidrug transport system ATPase subunit